MTEYARNGLVGILPPQANATVEAELGVLLPGDVGAMVSRLVSAEADPRARLIDYLQDAGRALRAFGSARPDVALFACTGSSYLVAAEVEQAALSGFAFPVISAAAAVNAALDALDASRIALVSPYPAWLTEACIEYWRRTGRRMVAVQSPAGDRSDTRRIYALSSADAGAALHALDMSTAQAVLVTGTGMPSLAAIARADRHRPILCSNLCLAWAAMCRLQGISPDRASLEPWLAGAASWHARLTARFPALAEDARTPGGAGTGT